MIEGQQPTEESLKERVDINLAEGLTLEEIKEDTTNLLRDFEYSSARHLFQAAIYRDLLRYIDKRIADKNKVQE